MPKRKFKYRDHLPSTAFFVAWWTLSYAAFCIALWGLLEISPANALNWPMCTVGTVVMMVTLFTFQARLGRWFFNHSLQSWVDLSSVSSLLSIVLLAAVSHVNPMWAAAILTVPMALVQAVWLGRHSRWACLWPFVSLLVLWPAAEYPQLHQLGTFAMLIPVVGLIQGFLQGLLISQIWAKLPRQGKPKWLSFSDQSDEDTAIARLSLNEASDEVIDEGLLVTPQARQADLS